MSGFDAGASVDALNYDFTAFVDGVKGISPEPSAKQVQAFEKALRSAFRPVAERVAAVGAKNEPNDRAALIEAVRRFSDDEFADETNQLWDSIWHAVADLYSNQPTYEDIAALPFRAQRKFLGYTTGTFLSPER